MSYTNFCCRSGGSNLNAGTRTGDTTEPGTTPFKNYTGGSFSGDTFTVGSGNPQSDGVVAGDFCHVSDGAAVGRIARVASVTTTTIVLDTTATVGSGTGATVAKVGGAWLGPNGATTFPVNTITNVLTNSAGNPVRINLKNDQTYSITTGVSVQTRVTLSGYGSAYGDKSRAIIDGGTSTIVPLTVTQTASNASDLTVQNNGTTGSNAGVALGFVCQLERCVVNTVRGAGINVTAGAGGALINECEVYGCNTSNTASVGGITVGGTATGVAITRCVIHDNTGGNVHGLYISGSNPSVQVIDTIFDTNGLEGINFTAAGILTVRGCEFYNNAGDGIGGLANNSILNVENSNFIKNGLYGIDAGSNGRIANIVNCGFGAGTAANSSGTTNGVAIQETGSVTYASNALPWVDAPNGDFRINLGAAKGAGRGVFAETAASYAGTVGYPDIGAAQHIDPASGGSFTWVG